MISNKELFNENDIKFTNQRNIIYNILKSYKEPVSAEEIFQESKNIDDKISFSTIYRTLNVFIKKDLVLKYNLIDENISVYEVASKIDHKHYIKCLKCEKMVEIQSCPIKIFEEHLVENTGFEITDHKFELYGYCPDCKK